MINWKDPNKELPEQGQVVAVVYRHWKSDRDPRSYEIMVGTAYHYDLNGQKVVLAETDDMTGKGSWSVYIKGAPNNGYDVALGWCDPKELGLPTTRKEEINWEVDAYDVNQAHLRRND